MKAGTIVKIPGHSRAWVVLPVTRTMIRRGLNTDKPGMHLFGGAWYGRDLLNDKAYGKVLPLSGPRKVVGSVAARRTLKGDLRVPSTAMKRIRERRENSAHA
jgi:hypothetical protein